MRRTVLAATLLLLVAATAHAQGGINLFWNSCLGPSARTFACNTNSGNNFLFGSFIPPAGVTQLSANEIVVEIMSQSATMPSWWEFKNTGACRQNALSISFDATTDASGNCADYWQGQAAGGIGAYQVMTPARRRIVAVGAVPPTALGAVDAGTEYFSFRLAISNVASTGTGSCAGCTTPACIVLQSIKLTQPIGIGDYLLSAPAMSNCATWQGGITSCCLVPTRNRTWGGVKALYR